jgi:nitroreductase
VHRRTFLQGAIASVVVSRGRVWRLGDGLSPAAVTDALPIELVRAAVLAASGHNAQPWLFRVSPSRIDLYSDTARTMGMIDPYQRDMHLGLGCALENLVLAAGPNGYRATVTLASGHLTLASSEDAPVRVAVVNLARAERASNALFDAIPGRHTNRQLYDPSKPVPASFTSALSALSQDEDVTMFLVTDDRRRHWMADATMASVPIFRDSAIAAGNNRWARTTTEDLDRAKDGYISAPDPTAKGVPHPTLMLSAPLFGMIAVRDRYDRAQALRAGRLWQRAHLLATTYGIAARPDGPAIELIDYERRLGLQPAAEGRLAGVTGDSSWQPTMLFYMGYATADAIPSARRPVSDVVLPASPEPQATVTQK